MLMIWILTLAMKYQRHWNRAGLPLVSGATSEKSGIVEVKEKVKMIQL